MTPAAALAAAYETVTGRSGTIVERARYAPATLAAYAEVIGRFEGWLAGRGLALPVTAETVCAYLEEIAGAGLAPSTVRQYAAAISVAHQHRGAAFDWRQLRETLHRVARFSWRPPRQARPLLAEELKAILASLAPTRAGDVRDGALLTLG
jgi:site-specific recombinase XerD